MTLLTLWAFPLFNIAIKHMFDIIKITMGVRAEMRQQVLISVISWKCKHRGGEFEVPFKSAINFEEMH